MRQCHHLSMVFADRVVAIPEEAMIDVEDAAALDDADDLSLAVQAAVPDARRVDVARLSRRGGVGVVLDDLSDLLNPSNALDAGHLRKPAVRRKAELYPGRTTLQPPVIECLHAGPA